jgi:hypothetical protein
MPGGGDLTIEAGDLDMPEKDDTRPDILPGQ